MISEYSGYILVNINTLGPYIFVGCNRMLENSGVGWHKFHCIKQTPVYFEYKFIYFITTGITVNDEKIFADVKSEVRKFVGPVASFNHVVIVPKLPKTRSGKIARKTIAAMAAGKSFQVKKITINLCWVQLFHRFGLGLWCLTSLSTIFQLKFYWWRKAECLEKTTDKSLTNFIT